MLENQLKKGVNPVINRVFEGEKRLVFKQYQEDPDNNRDSICQ